MTLALGPYLTDWLNLLIRGLHVVAAIAWIGGSFYFIALDNQLEPPKRKEDDERGVGGESWEIHGGGFYRIEKFKVAPDQLPETLHWTKWQAYTTWLSGFSLLVVLYYLNADQYLVDRSLNDISTGWLIAISLAMLGTIMAANVFFVIIPAHWQLVRAKERGEAPDPRHNIRGKQRSVHNNYFTLPVLVAMLSSHFAFAYGRSRGWLVLVALMVLGALVRHFYNRRHAGTNLWWIPAVVALALVGLAFALRPAHATGVAGGGAVAFARVQSIVDERCLPCHSQTPKNDAGISVAPMGVEFDTPEQIVAQAQLIKTQAVTTHEMPIGNLTHMTDAERAAVGAWVDQGAKR